MTKRDALGKARTAIAVLNYRMWLISLWLQSRDISHREVRALTNHLFPSSKRCNPCGYVLDKLPLQIREWTCPRCNNLNLRDKNAALNILGAGLALLACGESSIGESSMIKIDDDSRYDSLKQESPLL